MFDFLLNIPLKFKFWLLNCVSFFIVCLLVLCSVNLNYLYILEKQKTENEHTLDVVIKAIDKVSEKDRITLVTASAHLILNTSIGKTYRGTRVQNVETLISTNNGSSNRAFHKEAPFLSFEPDLIGHEAVSPHGWSVARYITAPSRLIILKEQAPQYALIVLILMCILLLCSQLLISFFEKHINSLKSVMIHVKKTGDLRARVEIESQDEVGQMASSFNEMQGKYQKTVKLLAKTAHLLHESATSLKDGAVITERNMSSQQEETVSILDSITQLSAVANEVAKNASDMQAESESASILTASGQDEVLSSKQVSNRLNDEISQVSSLVERLQQDTKRIDSTTSEIQVISEQTSLLALNAAIEAARAGDSGRGFAVVADEVRALAQHAHDSSEKIQELVDAIRNVTSEIINVMESGMTTAEHSVESASRTVDLFAQIRELTDNIKESNLLVASASEEQSQTSVGIATSLEHVKEGADKVLSGAISVTKSAEEITSLADELEKIVDSMIV